MNRIFLQTEGSKSSCRIHLFRTTHTGWLAFAITWIAFGVSGQIRVIAALEYVGTDPKTGNSKAVVVDSRPLVHTTQLLPFGATGEIVGKNDPDKQFSQLIAHLETNLKEAQSSLDELVKLNVYAARIEMVPQFQEAMTRRLSGSAKPAVSFAIGALPHPDALVALDAVAVSRLSAGPKVRRTRVDSGARAGPFATVAILPAGSVVYVSGQAERGELAEATRKTMESLMATLSHLGLNRLHVVQLKAFMRPMSDVAVVKKEIARFSDSELAPPTVFVEWVSATPIEIELIASTSEPLVPAAEPVRYFTPPGVKASPLYSRVARIDSEKTIYVSGLYGSSSETGEGQIREIFESLQEILQKTGSDFRHLAKATYYVATDEASAKLNELRPNYYDPTRPPAASKAMVHGVGVPGKSVTMDMIAVPILKK